MLKYLLFYLIILQCSLSFSQSEKNDHIYTIDLEIPEKLIYSDHLKLGGSNSNGENISVNNFYISQNGKPIIPVTGEFHFSRYPEIYWDEAIKKMKSGGINMIATYIFWNMHEEIEGIFNWENNRNVRKFVELCWENNLPVIIRIGPFAHGEIRNGGLPDWLLAEPISIRSNDPEYLFYVERFFNEIGDQLKGLYFKDGGPIIAAQIENEYQHSAAPWGLTYPGQPYDLTSSQRDLAYTQEGVGVSKEENPYAELGSQHMQVLKSLAIKAGINTPLYTATGWGNAAIIPNETLPVTAAYPYPTWTDKKDLSPFYLYKDMHKNPDYLPVRYDPESYPVFAAELGGGIMSTYERRPIVPAESIDALINRCLGSGANGIGYYMYHGGSTPRGKYSFFNDEAYGYPKISYDFQAPIGEYGQTRDSFYRLKLLHEFLNTFGDILAPMQTVLPKTNDSIIPSNIKDLRYAVRQKEGSGFLFVNNFQDDNLTKKKQNIQIMLKTSKGVLKIPENNGFDLNGGENAIFPFNLQMEGIKLNYATAQLLTKADVNQSPYYVFFIPEGVKPEFSFENSEGLSIVNSSVIKIKKSAKRWLVTCSANDISEFIIRQKSGSNINILVVPKEFALKFWTLNIEDMKHLVFSDADILEEETGAKFLSVGENNYELFIYPKINNTPKIDVGTISSASKQPYLSHFEVKLPKVTIPFAAKKVSDKRLVIQLPGEMPNGLNDVILKIDYVGDTGMGFLDGELVADEFYKGIPWEIGLRYFVDVKKAEEMNFYFRPIYEGASFLVDLEKKDVPDFSGKTSFTDIREVRFIPKYEAIITFEW